MSTPTRELNRLNLRDPTMRPNLRSQSQTIRRARERVAREQALRERELAATNLPALLPSIEPSTGQTTANIVQGHSGAMYDVSQLPSDARLIASEGLREHKFIVDKSKKHGEGNGTYYAFQLQKRESVRVSYPSGLARMDCTCEVARQTRSLCQHVYWLYDGFNAPTRQATSSPQVVTMSEVLGLFTQLYVRIGQRIDVLPQELNKSLSPPNSQEDLQDELPQDELDEIIQDMLSVLHPKKLPDDFDDDFKEKIPSLENTFQGLVVPGDLETTVFALARHDSAFFERLRTAIPKDMCDLQLLRKLEARIERFFHRIDTYAESGPAYDENTIGACAEALVDATSKMHDYNKPPTSREFESTAARLGVFALEEVCGRNVDIYAGSTWHAGRTPDDEADRNLFARLIVSPEPSDDEEPAIFVLDLLDDLPPSALAPFHPRLAAVLDTLRQSAAPTAYTQKAQAILARSAPGASGAGPSARRPPVTDEREPRRRRLD